MSSSATNKARTFLLLTAGVGLAVGLAKSAYNAYSNNNSNKDKDKNFLKNKNKDELKAEAEQVIIPITNITRSLFHGYTELIKNELIKPNDEEIRNRLKKAYLSALESYPYRCVRELRFIEPRVSLHPQYNSIIKNNANVSNLNVLDVGCCTGTDLRQMLLDGVKINNILGVDINQTFLNIGMDYMFYDRNIIESRLGLCNVLEQDILSKNEKLSQFHNKGIDVIYCGSVYHLLGEQDCIKLTAILFKLLKPGGILFGRTTGSNDPIEPLKPEWDPNRYLHSVTSLTNLLKEYGFSDVNITVSKTDINSEQIDKEKLFIQPPQPIWRTQRKNKSAMFAFSALKPK